MGQRENLWGRYRPPSGITMHFTPDTDGMRLGGVATLTIHHHQPEPSVTVTADLNEWSSALLSHVFTYVWDAWKYGSVEQITQAFLVHCQKLESEWAGE